MVSQLVWALEQWEELQKYCCLWPILKDEYLTALDSDLQALNFFQDPHVILMCKQAGGMLIERFLWD